jgi:hypothetical protein
MEKIAQALKPGLTNAWNDYKKGVYEFYVDIYLTMYVCI